MLTTFSLRRQRSLWSHFTGKHSSFLQQWSCEDSYFFSKHLKARESSCRIRIAGETWGCDQHSLLNALRASVSGDSSTESENASVQNNNKTSQDSLTREEELASKDFILSAISNFFMARFILLWGEACDGEWSELTLVGVCREGDGDWWEDAVWLEPIPWTTECSIEVDNCGLKKFCWPLWVSLGDDGAVFWRRALCDGDPRLLVTVRSTFWEPLSRVMLFCSFHLLWAGVSPRGTLLKMAGGMRGRGKGFITWSFDLSVDPIDTWMWIGAPWFDACCWLCCSIDPAGLSSIGVSGSLGSRYL